MLFYLNVVLSSLNRSRFTSSALQAKKINSSSSQKINGNGKNDNLERDEFNESE